MNGAIDWGELKENHYNSEERFWFYKYGLLSHINLLATGMMPISLALSFYTYFVLAPNKVNKIFFYSTLILEILVIIVNGNRGSIIIDAAYMFSLFLVLRTFMSKKRIRVIKRLFVITLIPLSFLFIIITQSRFGSDMLVYYNVKYAGESFVNFNGLMYNRLNGTTDGRAYFTLFTRIFSPESADYETGIEKWDFIEKKTNVRGQYFYTIVGAFLFEFGKIYTMFIFLLFSLLCRNILKKNKVISLAQFLFYSVFVYLLINGVFYFKFQGSGGNVTLLSLFVFMMLFRNEKVISKK